jgi:hypothetical protein
MLYSSAHCAADKKPIECGTNLVHALLSRARLCPCLWSCGSRNRTHVWKQAGSGAVTNRLLVLHKLRKAINSFMFQRFL